jgi:hypothetical protein
MISVNAFILLIMAALRPAALECVPAPPLAALFTPPRPELGRYEACTSDAQLEGDADALEALDAFGSAGPYDRAAVQRLYGGTRVRVQRTWTATADEFVSTTRLSPYPDAALTRLQSGTLEIRWRLARTPGAPLYAPRSDAPEPTAMRRLFPRAGAPRLMLLGGL